MEATLSLALVDGERVAALSGAALDVINPATNQVIGQFPRCGERDVEVAVAAAKRAAPGWRATEPQRRAAALLAFADAVAERGEELARWSGTRASRGSRSSAAPLPGGVSRPARRPRP